jgi:undecaprenyl-diphosphatase
MSLRSVIHKFDTTVTGWINAVFGPSWRPTYEIITALGDPITVAVVTVTIIGSGLYQESARLIIGGMSITITVLIGALLKLLVERARPVNEYSLGLATFSFPSGHSSGSMITYGLLLYFAFFSLPQPWSYALAPVLALIPILVGVSRVYLGAHYPSDVVAGWLLGIAGLVIVVTAVQPLM